MIFLFLDLNFLFRSKTIDFYEVLWNFSSFIFWNLFMEICLLKIFSGDFSFSWRCVRGDLSFEDLFKRFFFFHKDLFMVICPLKICSGDFSHWRFIQEIFPFSWRFVHGDLFFEDWSAGVLSFFEDLIMEICHLKIYSGDFSFYEDVFMEIYPLKIEV